MPQIKESYESASILANDLIGGKWKMEVLWNIMHGHNRFSMIKREIPEISEKVLYTILKELEDTSLLLKEVVDDRPPKTVLYHLNPEHKGLSPLIESLYEFSHSYAGKKKIKLRKLVVNPNIHT
ncbi:MAG: helix-turn-helix transcriptional regulator [Lachnospiraceae bacterium]|nr:helix-turn-helix transcriptional regulator [Lachnospiraceae bacterium]